MIWNLKTCQSLQGTYVQNLSHRNADFLTKQLWYFCHQTSLLHRKLHTGLCAPLLRQHSYNNKCDVTADNDFQTGGTVRHFYRTNHSLGIEPVEWAATVIVMMKPAFSYSFHRLGQRAYWGTRRVNSIPKWLENCRRMFTEKSGVNNSFAVYRSVFPLDSPSLTFIQQLTQLCNQGRFPLLRSSRLSRLSEYKSNQSNLTNYDVYYRDIIKKCVNAGKDDVVVFTGSGTTGAIHKLIHALQLTGKVVEKSVSTSRKWIFSTTSRSLNILVWSC